MKFSSNKNSSLQSSLSYITIITYAHNLIFILKESRHDLRRSTKFLQFVDAQPYQTNYKRSLKSMIFPPENEIFQSSIYYPRLKVKKVLYIVNKKTDVENTTTKFYSLFLVLLSSTNNCTKKNEIRKSIIHYACKGDQRSSLYNDGVLS